MEGTSTDEEDPNHWETLTLAEEYISKLSLDGNASVDKLSGGWKKRVALARELAKQPDLLLLDEPTNHLDVESIVWLEELLSRASFSTLTITHDRAFLQNVSNRILELDRRNENGLLSVNGTYADYLDVKDQVMATQERHEVVLKNTLRRETEWLRRGAKARTTKQQARIYRAEDLKEEVEGLTDRNQNRSANMNFQSAGKNPKKLLEAKGISKSYGQKNLFSNMNLIVGPGTRIGFLGANGCGKSTLIRVLLGHEKPTTGEVTRSDSLQVAYFEQNRETLDPLKTVAKTICPSGDFVDYRGGRMHIRGYLDRFLFTPGQMEMAVGKLSGGEQSRLLLAKLMLTEANLLVLDEPTNDLDMATLNVLEECLTDFNGAVFLVTHDRYFLDQVASKIFAFGGKPGEVVPFADLEQWEIWRAETQKAQASAAKAAANEAKSQAKKKLSYNDQREFDGLEAQVHDAESIVAKLTAESERPEISSSASKLQEISQKLGAAQTVVDKLYARWSELEAMQKGFK